MTASALYAACDKGAAQSKAEKPTPGTPALRSGFILAATILASSLAFIDGSVVNAGLPAIGRSLGADGGGLAWVVNGYLLPLSALLLIGGAAGDVFGRRRVLVLGIIIFALASILCAVAPGFAWLLAGRIAQGIGAAMLMPNSLAILGVTFSGEARGQAIGTWAAVGAGAGALGPLIGGWLIDTVGWRSIFFVNLPVALAAIVLAVRYIPADARERHPPLDIWGAVFAAGGLAAMTWGLTAASAARGLDSASSMALIGGAVLIGGFFLVEARRGETAMMPLTLFTSRSFIGLTVLTLLLYGALGGLFVLVPYVLIESSGYSATMAGAALIPLPLVIALSSSQMGKIAARIGPCLPLTVGPLVVAAGFLLATRIGEPGSYFTNVLPAMLVIAAGLSGAVAPLTTAVLSSVAPFHTGVASGLNSAVARTGGLIVTALASAVLIAKGPELLAAYKIAAVAGAVLSVSAGVMAYAFLEAKPAS